MRWPGWLRRPRKRGPRIVDPRNPRPRLPDPGHLPEDPFGPRSVSQQDLSKPVAPRLLAFGILAGVAFLALLYNLYSLQLRQGERFSSLAEGNRVRKETVLAPRGIIFDRHGVQLVQNRGSFAVAVVPADLAKRGQPRHQELVRLEKLIGTSPEEVERQVRAHQAEPFQPLVLKKNLDPTMYQALSVNVPTMPGVRLQADTTRHYVVGAGLSHILGYVGKLDPEEYKALRDHGYLLDDQIGKTGLEVRDEDWLRGKSGERVVETDAVGRVVRELSSTDPLPGDNVYTNLDLGLQRETAVDLQTSMDAVRKKFPGTGRGQAGAAIALNPQTGEVLSLVSLPDYDLNLFADGISTAQYQTLINDKRLPMLNRAIDGQYPPGSTFKPVTGSAALQSGAIGRGGTVFCPGHLTRGGFNFLCWNTSGHGSQDIVQAIAHSCDVFFYTVADQMGDQLLSKFARDFGVGRKTGIDLAPEGRGIAPDRDWKKRYFAEVFQQTGDPAWQDSYWYQGNTITYGIGQSYLLVTPLQDLEWTATVANGGRYLRPQLTGNVHSAVDGSPVRQFNPLLDHKVQVSPEVLGIIREGLRLAAEPGGTSGFVFSQAASKNVPSPSGKTGTAQYGLPDQRGDFPTHAWYTAYAPAVDPEVAVVVFVDGGGEGHEAAAPVAAQILSYYFAHRDAIRATQPPPNQASAAVVAVAAGG